MNSRKLLCLRLWPLFVFSFLLIIYLGYFFRNHQVLRQQGSSQTEHLRENSAEQGASIGSMIPQLRGRTITHQTVSFDLSNRRHDTLLFVFSPICTYCRVNFHNWRSILQVVAPDQVLWVDVTGTADTTYLASYGIPKDENIVLLDDRSSKSNLLAATPTTVLLDPHGAVRWSVSGVMNEEQVSQLQYLLKHSKP